MRAIYQTATEVIDELAPASKMFLLGLFFLVTLIGICNIDTAYTTTRPVETTIIAKTQATAVSKSGATPYFIVAVRHADGTLEDVRTSFARYSQLEVGQKLTIMTSDSALGRPIPLTDIALIVVIVLTGLGTLGSFSWALIEW